MTKINTKGRAALLRAGILTLLLAFLLSGSSCGLLNYVAHRVMRQEPEVTPLISAPTPEPTTVDVPNDVTEKEAKRAIDELMAVDLDMFEAYVSSDALSLYYYVASPEAIGIKDVEATFGEMSEEDWLSYLADYEIWHSRLLAIDTDVLPIHYQIIYDFLLYDIEETLMFKDYLYHRSLLNSLTGVQSSLPLLMAQWQFEDKKSIETYLLLMHDFDRYYADIMVLERTRTERGLAKTDEQIDAMVEACEAFIGDVDTHFLTTSFEERLDMLTFLTPYEKQKYCEQNRTAIKEAVFPAYELLIDGLTELKGERKNADGGLYYMPDGQAYYERYLRYRCSRDTTVDEVTKWLDDEINRSIQQIIMLINSVTVIDDDYVFSKGSIADNILFCQDLVKDDFPALMEHNLLLQEVPLELQDNFSPAAYLTCRVDDPTHNVVLTNPSSLAGTKNIVGMMAHEAYPGHLYQNVYHAEHITSYCQRAFGLIGYSEGWAEYADAYVLARSGYDPDLVRYATLEDKIFNKYIPTRIDIGVHYEGWLLSDVEQYLIDTIGIDLPDYAAYVYDMVLEIPCYFTPYAVGYIQTQKIIDEAIDAYGNKDIIDIHRAYLSVGPAPFHLIETYMPDFIEP